MDQPLFAQEPVRLLLDLHAEIIPEVVQRLSPGPGDADEGLALLVRDLDKFPLLQLFSRRKNAR